jgi:hypothetical protein
VVASQQCGYFGARFGTNISNNVAKLSVEYSISIPREQFRPGYGEGFAGAPVTLQAAPRGQGSGIEEKAMMRRAVNQRNELEVEVVCEPSRMAAACFVAAYDRVAPLAR